MSQVCQCIVSLILQMCMRETPLPISDMSAALFSGFHKIKPLWIFVQNPKFHADCEMRLDYFRITKRN